MSSPGLGPGAQGVQKQVTKWVPPTAALTHAWGVPGRSGHARLKANALLLSRPVTAWPAPQRAHIVEQAVANGMPCLAYLSQGDKANRAHCNTAYAQSVNHESHCTWGQSTSRRMTSKRLPRALPRNSPSEQNSKLPRRTPRRWTLSPASLSGVTCHATCNLDKHWCQC